MGRSIPSVSHQRPTPPDNRCDSNGGVDCCFYVGTAGGQLHSARALCYYKCSQFGDTATAWMKGDGGLESICICKTESAAQPSTAESGWHYAFTAADKCDD